MEKTSTRSWDWLSAGILFLLLQVAAGRLAIANWAPFLYFAETLAALGTMLGLALGYSRFNRRTVTVIAIDYTLIVLSWQWTAAVQDDLNLGFREQLRLVTSRLGTAFVEFVQRAPVNDSFFFIAFISLVLWIVGLTAGYWLIRHDNLPAAVIPSAIVIIITQVYDSYYALRSWWLAVYLFLVLFLIGRRYFLHSRAQWKQQHIATSEDAWPDILNGLSIITLTVVVAAWIFPTSLSSLQAATETWNTISEPVRNRLSNAVVSLESPYSNGGSNFYSESLTLGRNAAQGNQTMFTVKVLSAPISSTPFYWRARAYDYYANGQWGNSSTTSIDFQPSSQSLNLVNAQNRDEGQFQFTMYFQQSLLYAPSEPVWVNQPGSVSVTSADDGQNDPIAWFADPAVSQGSRYQVRAEIADPTIEELEAAGTNYPAWVQNRYLEIPQDIQPTIQNLAEQVTSGQSTPYDKASAITDYLRKTIEYSTTVPPPPTGEDPAVWVLFDYKKGFCNYYASAEALMLRSIGIPARVAVGFAEGEVNEESLSLRNQQVSYTVRERDAHAWPEVYFPNIGWVEFEPTVSQNPIVRPATKEQIGVPQNDNPPSNANTQNQNPSPNSGIAFNSLLSNQPLTNILGISFLVAVIGLILIVLRRYRLLNQMPIYLSNSLERVGISTPGWIKDWIHWNQMTSAERSFNSINWSLQWLGSPQPVYATASERAAALGKLLPSAKEYIETVTTEHLAALFTKRSADVVRARRAGLMIIVITLRFTILKFWNAISGGDVYSDN